MPHLSRILPLLIGAFSGLIIAIKVNQFFLLLEMNRVHFITSDYMIAVVLGLTLLPVLIEIYLFITKNKVSKIWKKVNTSFSLLLFIACVCICISFFSYLYADKITDHNIIFVLFVSSVGFSAMISNYLFQYHYRYQWIKKMIKLRYFILVIVSLFMGINYSRLLGYIFLSVLIICFLLYPLHKKLLYLKIALLLFFVLILIPFDITTKNVPGPPKIVLYIVGYPGPGLIRKASKHEVFLGGCVMRGHEPSYVLLW